MSERLEDLLAAMCAGDLTSAEQGELDALLATDPSALSAAIDHWRLHRLLPLALRGARGDWFPTAVGEAVRRRPSAVIHHSTANSPAKKHRPGRPAPRRILQLALAAAAALLIAMLGMWHVARSAAITGNDAPPGVVVVGDGHLVARGAAWHLAEGRVDIRADHRAKALIFTTPHLQVEIVGTSFSLEVGPTATTVMVREGRVRVTVGSAVREIAAGEHLRSDDLASHLVWSPAWPTTATTGWTGLPQPGGGLLAQANRLDPGNLVVWSPRMEHGPVIPAGSHWFIDFRSLAPTPVRGAFWLLVKTPSTGEIFTCQVDLTLVPGNQTRTLDVSEFKNPKTGLAVNLSGAQIWEIGLQSWDGRKEGFVWSTCELLASDIAPEVR